MVQLLLSALYSLLYFIITHMGLNRGHKQGKQTDDVDLIDPGVLLVLFFIVPEIKKG